MRLTTRPLTDRSWVGTRPRTRSSFTTTWSSTLDLLEREVCSLQRVSTADPVLLMDITEDDLRLDGQVRANARPATSAVALSFESIRGPLMFRCDRYDSKPYGSRMELWQHNVRAIALTLEALRAVDRYGATSTGEQYAGWRQIEAKPDPIATPAYARFVLTELLTQHGHASAADRGDDVMVRTARRYAHPDRGGSRTEWDRVEECARLLLGVQP
ncbi:hypothetical protein [Calidifontibacter indicus]|uniref:hypothetical protein n=1 Tax=Calidifontibacter indicus TaxID=419650 RepID=UPI003D73039F